MKQIAKSSRIPRYILDFEAVLKNLAPQVHPPSTCNVLPARPSLNRKSLLSYRDLRYIPTHRYSVIAFTTDTNVGKGILKCRQKRNLDCRVIPKTL